MKTKNPHGAMKQVTSLGGKAAVFCRGFIESMEQNGPSKLRKAQEAGVAAVEELGETISIPYVSKLSGIMEVARIYTKERSGRSYLVKPGEEFFEMIEWFDSNDCTWGITIEETISDDVIAERSQFLDQMADDGAVRVGHDNPLGKAAYSLAREKFSQGEYDMVFVKRNWDIMAVSPLAHVEHDVTYISSVSDQK